MSYEVKITNQADSGDGVSIEARVEGVPVAHTFPKGMGFFEEPENSKPPFVEKLEEKYESKMKRQGKMAQSALTDEEKKIHSKKFLNQTYGEDEDFKDDKNQNKDMEDVDFNNPEEVRNYLKENMAEGYLSKSEESNIDDFVDYYTELMQRKDEDGNVQEVVRRAYEVKVQ